MKLSNELRGLPIVSIAEGEEVGIVKDFIFDPGKNSVVGIVVEDRAWFKGAKAIRFSRIHNIGDYAVTVENTSAVVELGDEPEFLQLLDRNIPIVGSKVITKGGRMIGFIREFSVDTHTGQVTGFELAEDLHLKPQSRKLIIPQDQVITVGRDVLVVTDDVESFLVEDFDTIPSGSPAPRRAESPKAAPVIADADPELTPILSGMGEPAEDDVLAAMESASEMGYVGNSQEEPASAPAAEKKGGSMLDVFKKRQIAYLKGKKVSKDIENEAGDVIVHEGEVIDDDVIDRADGAGKFMELSMSVAVDED